MIFEATKLAGAYVIRPEPRVDARGFFARTWCAREFEAHGLTARLVQANLSFNHARGTLRGMHYQQSPHEESKLVRCTRGSIFDAIIDLRSDSPTRGDWFGTTLTAENRAMLFVPEGFAHGFQTLEDDTEVVYQVSEFYTPQAERGIHYADPSFAIEWPVPVTAISDKDAGWPPFAIPASRARHG
jgi:dTDP-4-dehydrorhamnose 3,5-epimerase